MASRVQLFFTINKMAGSVAVSFLYCFTFLSNPHWPWGLFPSGHKGQLRSCPILTFAQKIHEFGVPRIRMNSYQKRNGVPSRGHLGVWGEGKSRCAAEGLAVQPDLFSVTSGRLFAFCEGSVFLPADVDVVAGVSDVAVDMSDKKPTVKLRKSRTFYPTNQTRKTPEKGASCQWSRCQLAASTFGRFWFASS